VCHGSFITVFTVTVRGISASVTTYIHTYIHTLSLSHSAGISKHIFRLIFQSPVYVDISNRKLCCTNAVLKIRILLYGAMKCDILF